VSAYVPHEYPLVLVINREMDPQEIGMAASSKVRGKIILDAINNPSTLPHQLFLLLSH
jgi:hypothetical protein